MAALERIMHGSVRVKSDSRIPQRVRDARIRVYLLSRATGNKRSQIQKETIQETSDIIA